MKRFYKKALVRISAGIMIFVLAAAVNASEAQKSAKYYVPAPQNDGQHFHMDARREARTHVPLPPLPSNRAHLRRSHGDPDTQLQSDKVLAGCSVDDFANSSGSALVNLVKAAEPSCINTLFSITANQGAQVFPEGKMVTIADAVASESYNYTGNNSGGMLQLILFLRAGYYIQYYNSDIVGPYGSALDSSISAALDNFVANSHFGDINEDHGEVLSEFVTLIDSSEKNAQHIDTIGNILSSYSRDSHAGLWYMMAAVNNVFIVLFRGHYLEEFRDAVQTPTYIGLLDDLVSFVQNNEEDDIGSDREYLLQNAAGELARFLNSDHWDGYPEDFHNTVHPKARDLLNRYSMTGYGAGIYVRMAGVIDYYDYEHCEYFDLCSFIDDLEEHVLPDEHARECSNTLKVRSQALTGDQMDWVCSTIADEKIYFHDKLDIDPQNPVADDYNEQLEMVIFHSSSDYETYAGTLFGIDTNNGGMYLEGDPSVPGNQARFIAYEAEWLRPEFDVWNLTHEYIHYLDGRYIWYGMFQDYPLDAPNSGVWFFEGFAEYMSYSFRNLVYSAAVQEAGNPDKYSLTTILDNDYSSDQARIYQWGYMAVRFMFERHENDIDSMIAIARQGEYDSGYPAWLDTIRNRYDSEFREWLVCYASNNGDTSSCGGEEPPRPDSIFDDRFEGSGEEPPEDPDPDPDPEIHECTDEDDRELGNDCKRSELSGPSPASQVWLYANVPSGQTRLEFRISGGTGDVDVYHKAGEWPSQSEFDQSSTNTGNDEHIQVNNPGEGWHYLLLVPKTDFFEDVEVSAHWQ